MSAGQGDMAYGALLGAGSFVNMYVVGSILRSCAPQGVPTNVALLRDIASYLAMLALLVPAFTLGLSLANVVAMASLYATVLGKPPPTPACVCRSAQAHALTLA